jgi:hypothetical protein
MIEALARGGRRTGEQHELWAMDEHRLGLKPLMRRIWAKRGQRPVCQVHQRYEWLYLYGFVHPNSGRSFWALMPTVSIAAFNAVLRHFAQFVQPSTRHRVTLLVDNAGWHSSPAVECPLGLDLDFLPAYSPELQPAEHLWAMSDLPLFNRCFEALDQLESLLIDRCTWLQTQLDLVRSATRFHWWPREV